MIIFCFCMFFPLDLKLLTTYSKDNLRDKLVTMRSAYKIFIFLF